MIEEQESVAEISSEKVEERRASLNYFSSDDMMKHLVVKVEGYTIAEILEEYRLVNDGFVKAIDKLEELLTVEEITRRDIDYLESLEFYYHKREITRRDARLMPSDIFRNILQGTFSETVAKAKEYFGDPKHQDWKVRADLYKAEFIKRGGEHFRTLIRMIDKLQRDLSDLFNDYYQEDDRFSKLYSFEEVMDNAEEYEDLQERKQYLKQTIVDCKTYCLRCDYGKVAKETEEEFTDKCYKAIEIIDLQLEYLQDEEPVQSLSTVQSSSTAHPILQHNVYIASKRKTDIIKILSAMYDARMFAGADGKPLTNKQKLMEAFGEFLGDDFSSYSTLLSQSKVRDEKTFMKPFRDIEKAAKRYFNE